MKMNQNGRVIWEGRSLLDRQTPIVVVAVAVRKPSDNVKTGDMIQAIIMRQDMSPLDSVQKRLEVGVCGTCIHRPRRDGTRTCYVNVGRMQAIYKCYAEGRYPQLHPVHDGHLLRAKPLRIGTWGDPAAVPPDVWLDLIEMGEGQNHTGYTHQWRFKSVRKHLDKLSRFCMASVETDDDVIEAQEYGFRYFRTRPEGTPAWPGELECPASRMGGYTATCATCGLCAGSTSPGPDITIEAHGTQSKYFTIDLLHTD